MKISGLQEVVKKSVRVRLLTDEEREKLLEDIKTEVLNMDIESIPSHVAEGFEMKGYGFDGASAVEELMMGLEETASMN